MKMGDGGFRPAFNVQFATIRARIKSSWAWRWSTPAVTWAQLAPMVEQVERRLGQSPQQWLVDGGFPAHEDRFWCQSRIPAAGHIRAPKKLPRKRVHAAPTSIAEKLSVSEAPHDLHAYPVLFSPRT